MTWFNTFLASNIGRKLVMALTGLFLISFLVVHLSGNFLLLKHDQGEAFNVYSQFMTTAGIIRVLEIVLLLGFLFHIYTSAVLTRRNQASRPQGYAAGNKTPGVHWYSKNMGITGSLILVFLVLHIRTFWYTFHEQEDKVRRVAYQIQPSADGSSTKQLIVITPANEVQYTSIEVYKDMALLAQEAFNNPIYVIFYVVTFLILGAHLMHGFSSAWRTLGFEHKKYTPLLKGIGVTLAVVIPLGFAVIPIIYYVTKPLGAAQL